MKRRIIGAALLTVCFSFLALLSGAIPVTAKASSAGVPAEETRDIEAAAREDGPRSDAPAEDEEESPAEDGPGPAEDDEEAEDDEDAEIPADGETASEAVPEEAPAAPEGNEPEVVTLTLTGELLQNDTYYDVDPQALLAEGSDLRLPEEGYQILIIHTHATEAYRPGDEGGYETADGDDCRTTDPRYSVIRVGDELADALAAYGLNVLHDTGLHDYPGYSGSYARSGAAVEEYLAAYPGIRVVIDLHRDAIDEEGVVYRTLADIDGTEAAQLLFVMGTDVNLEHPAWRENLKLALALHDAVRTRYPTLMRPTVLCDCRYNQQLAPGSLLLEVGTAGNTLDEALEGVRRFAEIAGPFLADRVGE